MEDTVGMALAMAMGVLDTVMARGLLTLTLMLTTAMVGPTPATAMVVLDMAMVDTGTAKGLLTLRLMPTTAMEDMDLGMALAMADTTMGVLATVMARGRLMPSLTMVDTVGPTLVLDMATAAMVALSVDTATSDKECQKL